MSIITTDSVYGTYCQPIVVETTCNDKLANCADLKINVPHPHEIDPNGICISFAKGIQSPPKKVTTINRTKTQTKKLRFFSLDFASNKQHLYYDCYCLRNFHNEMLKTKFEPYSWQTLYDTIFISSFKHHFIYCNISYLDISPLPYILDLVFHMRKTFNGFTPLILFHQPCEYEHARHTINRHIPFVP